MAAKRMKPGKKRHNVPFVHSWHESPESLILYFFSCVALERRDFLPETNDFKVGEKSKSSLFPCAVSCVTASYQRHRAQSGRFDLSTVLLRRLREETKCREWWNVHSFSAKVLRSSRKPKSCLILLSLPISGRPGTRRPTLACHWLPRRRSISGMKAGRLFIQRN